MPLTNPIPDLTPAEIERLHAGTITEGECLIWQGNKNYLGYGRFKMRGKRYVAHRVMWEAVTGEKLPTSIEIDHTCHRRDCLKVEHLRKVTRKQNMENHRGALRNSKSGVRGVCWVPSKNRWVAQLSHHGQVMHIGYFTDIRYAEAAVIAKRNELQTHNDADRSHPDRVAFSCPEES